MSQPPSLPKLTSFLRPTPQQQAVDMTGGRGVAGVENVGRGPSEKRRLDGAPERDLRGAVRVRDAVFEDESVPQQQRQKRRANLFLQYGEQEEFHRQQQQQLQEMRGFDPRQQPHQQQRASPHLVPPTQSLQHQQRIALPPAQQQRQSLSFPEFAGNYDRNSMDRGRLVPPAPMPVPSAGRDARRATPVKTEPPSSTQEPAFPRERTSRYLSESDRRSIILRIDSGEKQVALAKEYQVSRAAICNLYKNRKEVLTRSDKNPKAKHPKRGKAKPASEAKTEEVPSDATPQPVDSTAEDKDLSEDLHGDDDHMSEEHSSTESNEPEIMRMSVSSPPLQPRRATPEQTARVYDSSTSSAPIRRMMRILRNPQLPLATYRQVFKRLASSLLEEVVACLPRHEVNVATSSGYQCPSVVPLDDSQICAISIDPQGPFMLPTFVEIFPSASAGTLSLTRSSGASNQPSSWKVVDQRLPAVDSNCYVILLVASCANGARVSTALEHLTSQTRISPSSIYVATIISSQPGLTRLHRQFPDVTFISAAIDDGVDAQGCIRPGIGDVMQRFFH